MCWDGCWCMSLHVLMSDMTLAWACTGLKGKGGGLGRDYLPSISCPGVAKSLKT